MLEVRMKRRCSDVRLVVGMRRFAGRPVGSDRVADEQGEKEDEGYADDESDELGRGAEFLSCGVHIPTLPPQGI